MNRNIAYQTDQLVRFFDKNRVKWAQFYKSERIVIGELALDSQKRVLDIGCGCGGLGLALYEEFGVNLYTGVEINPLAAAAGRLMNSAAQILCGDVLTLSERELLGRDFDAVFSLSCIDWNVQFDDMFRVAWSFVKPGGVLVITLRLVNNEGCNDIRRSYQYINYKGIREGECAAYVVVNASDLMRRISAFDPASVSAYGYWGSPSATAITPYDRLCFTALSIRKRAQDVGLIRLDLRLPIEIRGAMEVP